MTSPPVSLTLKAAFFVWLRIGLLSFGGPAGQIALMHRELVERRKWISEERFLHALNFCTLLPGPEAAQLATYIGWLLHKTPGGLVAGACFVVPGALLMLGLSTIYWVFHRVAIVDALFFGIKAAVLAVVVEAVLRVGKRALQTRRALVVAALSFTALFCFSAPFPLVIALSAAVGWAGLVPKPTAPAARQGQLADLPLVDLLFAQGAAEHTKPVFRASVRTAAIWLTLWAAPVAAVWGWRGGDDVLTREAVLFSEAATVTFGGAYAVLAWVTQEVVTHFHWLSAAQMVDGLGLAETTPGPLILVLQFVGFTAAAQQPGGLPPMVAATLGAAITLWVTFVPCFLWVFLFGPWVEAMRENVKLSAALSAITAAVVGVILNLSVFFATHVLFGEVTVLATGPVSMPVPQWSTLDLKAAGVCSVAFLMLFALKQNLGRTLVVCAAIGVALKGFT